MKKYILLLLTIYITTCYAQNETKSLTTKEVENDLEYLEEILQSKSSYQGLNGYNYKEDFNTFLESIGKNTITTRAEFGLFLSKTIGKIGDRHSYVKGYDLPESLYLPLSFAPFKEKVLVLDYVKDKKELALWNSEYPYLKSINNIPIENILPKVLPGEALAPKNSYLLRAVRDLRDIETVFSILGLDLPNPLPITLTNEKGSSKKVTIELVPKGKKARIWDERYHKSNFFFNLKEEELNNKAIIEKFFALEDNIAYVQIPSMVEKNESPVFFELLSNFMMKAKQSDALIIDVRDNGGGTRDLIQELAGYFIHPDSVYVVNDTKQRAPRPLSEEFTERLHGRFLFSFSELDDREQKNVKKFLKTFKPMYDLDSKKFSEYYFYILNGQKITKNKYHYNKPIYILANERTFSAASVLVSVFKDLPNIKIVGVNTDGSSGNSDRFELPNSELRGKISTMVSYQKNGKVLDGIGTKPNIIIERNLKQILFKEDYQLKKLKNMIKNSSK